MQSTNGFSSSQPFELHEAMVCDKQSCPQMVVSYGHQSEVIFLNRIKDTCSMLFDLYRTFHAST
jgi:hypothetical protein